MDKLQVLANWMDRLAGDKVARLARWQGVVIFNYHRIGEASQVGLYDQAVFSATQDGFAEQMAFLARHFDVIDPADLAQVAGQRKGRHVMVTFDDGYRDNFDLAFPVLKAQGIGATFFITTNFLDEGVMAWWDEVSWMVRRSTKTRIEPGEWLTSALSLAPTERPEAIKTLLAHYKRLKGDRCARFIDWLADATGSGRCPRDEILRTWMTWDMVREMRDGGMTIGGHTINHPILSRLTAEQQRQEIQGCAARLREELNEAMRWFAYPVGSRNAFNADTRRALTDAGVEFAFSYYGGYNPPGKWDELDMRRVAVELGHGAARFRATACLPSLFGAHDEPLTMRLRGTANEFFQ